MDLEELVPDFLNDRRALADPAHPEEGEIGYHYYGSGATGAEPPETIFLASKNETHGQRRGFFFLSRRTTISRSTGK